MKLVYSHNNAHLHTWIRKWICECDAAIRHVNWIDARSPGCTTGRFVYNCSVCLEPGYEVPDE